MCATSDERNRRSTEEPKHQAHDLPPSKSNLTAGSWHEEQGLSQSFNDDQSASQSRMGHASELPKESEYADGDEQHTADDQGRAKI